MYHVSIKKSRHNWDKKNLVSKPGKKGHYDEVECTNCGIKGRRYGFTEVSISESYSKEKAFNCPKAPPLCIPERIKITFCTASGRAFGNLIPGSEHDVLECPPEPYKNDNSGVWVMGVGEPVKVLREEFVEVK